MAGYSIRSHFGVKYLDGENTQYTVTVFCARNQNTQAQFLIHKKTFLV